MYVCRSEFRREIERKGKIPIKTVSSVSSLQRFPTSQEVQDTSPSIHSVLSPSLSPPDVSCLFTPMFDPASISSDCSIVNKCETVKPYVRKRKRLENVTTEQDINGYMCQSNLILTDDNIKL